MKPVRLEKTVIAPGESLRFEFCLSSSKDWEGKLHVQARRGGEDLITPREIESVGGGRFAGYLADVETAVLEPGMYFLVGKFSRPLDQRFQEKSARFTVRGGF